MSYGPKHAKHAKHGVLIWSNRTGGGGREGQMRDLGGGWREMGEGWDICDGEGSDHTAREVSVITKRILHRDFLRDLVSWLRSGCSCLHLREIRSRSTITKEITTMQNPLRDHTPAALSWHRSRCQTTRDHPDATWDTGGIFDSAKKKWESIISKNNFGSRNSRRQRQKKKKNMKRNANGKIKRDFHGTSSEKKNASIECSCQVATLLSQLRKPWSERRRFGQHE